MADLINEKPLSNEVFQELCYVHGLKRLTWGVCAKILLVKVYSRSRVLAGNEGSEEMC